jgi:Alpha/beta hydrolase family
MAAYVLVHGGWSGAHGFRHVRRRLAAAGEEVFTPSLTGVGERAHLASPVVDLSTHVRDVANHVLSHPIGCFTEPVRLARPLEEFGFARTYIKATLDPPTDLGADALNRAAQRAKASPAWRYRELATTHMVPSNRPDELTKLLLDLDT